MEVQIDELTSQLQQKEHEVLQLQQNLDFNSSFDLNNTKGASGLSDRSMSMQAQRLNDENEYLNSQIRSHLNTIEEQKQQIAKYQNMENQSHSEMEQKTAELRMLGCEHQQELKKLEEECQAKLREAELEADRAKQAAEAEITEMKE